MNDINPLYRIMNYVLQNSLTLHTTYLQFAKRHVIEVVRIGIVLVTTGKQEIWEKRIYRD